jgi:hypothetical protein
MTSEERGQEVVTALNEGIDRETVAMVVKATHDRSCPPGTVLSLARQAHQAWPYGPGQHWRTMEDHLARVVARYGVVPPPSPPSTPPLDPRASPGGGFGRVDKQMTGYRDFWAQLRETQSRDTRGEARPKALDSWDWSKR